MTDEAHGLWTGLSGKLRATLEAGRLSIVLKTVESFLAHRGPARAAALSYTTLLALVPILALVLGISKAVLHDQAPTLLSDAFDRFLAYAVPQLSLEATPEFSGLRDEVLARTTGAIDQIDAGALGIFGSIVLVVVAVSLLSSIEHAFNDVWGIRRGRPIGQRIVYYWTGVTLGSILLFVSLLLTSSTIVTRVLGILPGPLGMVFWFFVPFVVLSTGFTLLYWIMPNTRVPFLSALGGGVAAGTLFQLNNLASALYVSRVLGYSRVYGSLGAVPILMVGLYFSWLIVLLGAEISRAITDRSEESAGPIPDFASRLRLALEVARESAAAFLAGRGGATSVDITKRLEIPSTWVNETIGDLCEAGILLPVGDDDGDGGARYVPSRPPDAIPLVDILERLRTGNDDSVVPASGPEVSAFLDRLHDVERETFASMTLASLARTQAETQ